MGATVVHQGPAGAGQHTKLTNQMLVAGNLVAVCEALLYATRAGLDVRSVLAVDLGWRGVELGAVEPGPAHRRGRLRAGFFVDHFVKDMAIVLDEAARLRLALPGLALVHQLTSRSRRRATAATARSRSSSRWKPCHQRRRHRSEEIAISSRISAVRSGCPTMHM